MRNIIILLFTIFILGNINAQENIKPEKKKKITIQTHGFIKTDFWYDSRQVIYAREGIFTIFPKDVLLNKMGNDINANPSFNFSAITSRLNFRINGFDAFGAKTSGFIEADFSGVSNASINTFRLRHAYLQMKWKHNTLLMGQYWHPMFVTEAFPSVTSLNTGSPFQPFIRNPQIRFTQKIGKLKLIAAVLSQRDYSSKGPKGRNFEYISNGLVPNAHLQLQYKQKKTILGLAADYKSLRPRLITDSNIITNSRINSISYMLYYNQKGENLQIKSKFIWGENMTEHLLLGGYAVAEIDTNNDARTYTSTQHAFIWFDIDYIFKFKKFSLISGIFVGYAKNFGTKKTNNGIYYATGSNIDKLYRFAPSINIKSGNTMISMEWEHTVAQYGKINNTGIVNNTHSVNNERFLITAFYFF